MQSLFRTDFVSDRERAELQACTPQPVVAAGRRLSTRGLSGLLLASICMFSFGCAFGEIRLGDPFDRQYTFDEARHRYTVLIRFSEFQKAKDFVAEDERDAFIQRMDALEDARFTGYEPESVDLDSAKQSATVGVTYTLYTPAMPYEVEVRETQRWTRDGLTNKWRVSSSFEGLQELAAN